MLRLIVLIAIQSFTYQGVPFTGCLDVFAQIGDCPVWVPIEGGEAVRRGPVPTKPDQD